MTLEQQFKKETGLDAYIHNDLRGHIAIDTYVEWLEGKCNIPVVSGKAQAENLNQQDEWQIGGNAQEFVEKHRPNLSHTKKAELQAMLKDFAIKQLNIFKTK